MFLDLLLNPNTTIVSLLLTFAFLCFVLLFIPIYFYNTFWFPRPRQGAGTRRLALRGSNRLRPFAVSKMYITNDSRVSSLGSPSLFSEETREPGGDNINHIVFACKNSLLPVYSLFSFYFLNVINSKADSFAENKVTGFSNLIHTLVDPSTTIIAFLLLFAFFILFITSVSRVSSLGSPSLFFKETREPGGDSGVSSYSITRKLGLSLSFLPILWSIHLWILYDGSGQTFQCMNYVPMLHLSFGIDAVGLSLILLATAIFPICVLLMSTRTGIILFLILEFFTLGAFTVLDLFGFYITFESTLILLYLLIARNDDYDKIMAAYKIVLYTVAGGLPFLMSLLIIYSLYGTTNILILSLISISPNVQIILGFGLFSMFVVKIPLIPMHIWLPEAHVSAPTAGSVFLAAIAIKLGGLGLIRYLIPIFPVFVVKIFPFIAVMCIVSFLFSTLTTLRQVDLKKIIAYSSIAHMSLVTLAIFSLSEHSVASSTFMMVAHGLVSPALFLLVGFLYERSHTKYLPYLTGLGSHMPIYASLFFILTLANMAMPLSPNFIAEVLCLLSVFAVHSLYAYVFCISQVFTATYSIWTFNRVVHGSASVGAYTREEARNVSDLSRAPRAPHHCESPGIYYVRGLRGRENVSDLSRREFAIILPLLIGIFWLGLKPMA